MRASRALIWAKLRLSILLLHICYFKNKEKPRSGAPKDAGLRPHATFGAPGPPAPLLARSGPLLGMRLCVRLRLRMLMRLHV